MSTAFSFASTLQLSEFYLILNEILNRICEDQQYDQGTIILIFESLLNILSAVKDQKESDLSL